MAKILELIFLPPFGFIWLLVVLLVASRLLPPRLGGWGIGCCIVALYLCSIPAVVKPLMHWLTAPYTLTYASTSATNSTPIDAIAVLGAGQIETIDLTGKRVYRQSAMGQQRLDQAALVYQQQPKPIIVSAGKSAHATAATALSMATYLQQVWQIPASDIILEPNSKNTWDNARFIIDIAKQRQFNHLLYITSDWHLRRADWSLQNAIVQQKINNMQLTALGSPNTILPFKASGILQFVPQLNALIQCSFWFHEIVGLLVYRLTY